jgi:formimidoylglutamate deiminase
MSKPARRLFLETALLPSGWAHDVALDIADGTITAVMPNAAPTACERLPGIALPGLPNLHSHTFQRAMTGRSETKGPTDDSFWTWRQIMYAFLQKLTPDDIESIAAYAMMEMLETGFTALAEFHYLHHAPDGRAYANPAETAERIAAAAAQTGIGLTLLPVLYTHGGFGSLPPSQAQARFLNDRNSFEDLLDATARAIAPLADAVLGQAPHSLRAVSPSDLAHLAARPGPTHIHIAEQTREVEDCLAWSGQRPAAWLLNHTPIDQRWTLIHATHTDPVELAAIARSGATIGLCPITEANLGDGIFNAPSFRDAGGLYGVGTDSNVEITAAGELRFLEYGQRLARRARNVMPATEGASTGRTLYDAALTGGAQSVGRRIGRLAPGHRADLVLLDPTHPDLATATGDRILDAYIFSAGAGAIDTVIVAGRTLVTAGRHHARDTITARYRKTLATLV